MARFVVGNDRTQSTLFPERLDDYLGEDNTGSGRSMSLSMSLTLAKLGFGGVVPEATGRPSYHRKVKKLQRPRNQSVGRR